MVERGYAGGMPRFATLLAAIAVLVWPVTGIASAQNGCTTLGGTVDASNVCHVKSNNASYQMDIRFPLNFPDEQTVVDYLTQNRDGFVNVAQTPGSRNLPYEMDVTSQSFSSGSPSSGTQSVVLKLFQDVGGAHPVTWYKAFNYDLARHQAVSFDTLFAPGGNPLSVIYPIVRRDLERQTGLTDAVSDGDGLDPSRYQEFAITDDALIFFFGQGELLPSDAGALSVSLPRNAIPALQL